MNPSLPPRPENLPYRDCVGVMLINREGKIFVGQRIDRDAGEAWQMPQGGIDPGEDLKRAAFRELSEEIGTDRAEIIAESRDLLTYDLPPHLVGVALQGRYRGQRMKWFAMRFKGRDAEIDLNTHTPEFNAWRWVEIGELEKLVVEFKRGVYRSVVAEFGKFAKPV